MTVGQWGGEGMADPDNMIYWRSPHYDSRTYHPKTSRFFVYSVAEFERLNSRKYLEETEKTSK